MEQVSELIQYLKSHPAVAFSVAVAVAALLYLLMHKPKTVRQAESRLRQLHREKADQYRQPRFPR